MRAKLVLFFGFLLILFFPSQLGLHFWPKESIISGVRVDYLSPTLLFTDLLALLFIIFAHPTPSIKHLLWFIIPALNILFSPFPQTALFHWLRLIFYYLVFLSFQTSLPLFKKYWLSALNLSVFWVSALAIMQFINSSSLGGFWYWVGERPLSLVLPYISKMSLPNLGYFLRPYATFPHPNALAGYLLISLFLIHRYSNHLKNLTLFVGSIALLLTFSKIPIILGLIIFIYLSKKYILIPFGLLLIPLYSSTPFLPAFTERLLLINNSLLLIVHHLPTGVGLGAYPAATFSLPFTPPVRQAGSLQLSYQPVHNIFLLLLAELGLPIFGFVGYHLFKKLIPFLYTVNSTTKIVLIILLITGSFDHYWLTSPGNILLLTWVFSLLKSSYVSHPSHP